MDPNSVRGQLADVFDELSLKQHVCEPTRGNHLLDVLAIDVSLKVISPKAQVDSAGCISDHRKVHMITDTKSAPRPLVLFKYRCISRIDPAKFERMLQVSPLFRSPAKSTDEFANQNWKQKLYQRPQPCCFTESLQLSRDEGRHSLAVCRRRLYQTAMLCA